ncbi:hypothetical protein CAPTEDRAFT_152010 [Capitella teleta]|uniref:CREG-like beta-barrel domain-containing protein n=1 Tax=Capitella teleta TaxID=283909 RepID=R7TRA7_CAPTE|nr:hypothetical protein CAPTEDRAFT_152010 [Capitella teleta]|eukprot:ELT96438.1 hypothetical protein CAPTEDRAFT_152010 [Capitella teleta]
MKMKMEFSALLLVFLSSFLHSSNAVSWPDPPDWQQKPQMARYLSHFADWGVVAAVSPEYSLMPFGTIQSFADGTLKNSTGVPYFYISPMSDTYHNIQYNNSVALTISQAESDYCTKKGYDPEEPLCARLTLFGKMEPVKNSAELKLAKRFLFTRHPAMQNWPKGHGWLVHALRISGVCLLDFYGGASHISLSDYYAAKP